MIISCSSILIEKTDQELMNANVAVNDVVFVCGCNACSNDIAFIMCDEENVIVQSFKFSKAK